MARGSRRTRIASRGAHPAVSNRGTHDRAHRPRLVGRFARVVAFKDVPDRIRRELLAKNCHLPHNFTGHTLPFLVGVPINAADPLLSGSKRNRMAWDLSAHASLPSKP